MPIGLDVWDCVGDDRFDEAIADGDRGGPAGREIEIAEVLRLIKAAGVADTGWLTADVHHTAAHRHGSDRASSRHFGPFRESVSSPKRSGSFGPDDLHSTFGLEVNSAKAPTEERGANLPPPRAWSSGARSTSTAAAAG